MPSLRPATSSRKHDPTLTTMNAMKPNHPLRRLAPRVLGGGALAGCALASYTAHAGGIALYEIATPDVGLASAGYAAFTGSL